jgi:hypothetical protein
MKDFLILRRIMAGETMSAGPDIDRLGIDVHVDVKKGGWLVKRLALYEDIPYI